MPTFHSGTAGYARTNARLRTLIAKRTVRRDCVVIPKPAHGRIRSMNPPRSSHPSPPVREKVPVGRLRGIRNGSGSHCMRECERGLSMKRFPSKGKRVDEKIFMAPVVDDEARTGEGIIQTEVLPIGTWDGP